MFTILRMGNVFGFKKFVNFKKIQDNLVHNLCVFALFNREILIKNGSLYRSFIPSQTFILIIESLIKKNLFNNSIENIYFKNMDLKEVAIIIQKRLTKQ